MHAKWVNLLFLKNCHANHFGPSACVQHKSVIHSVSPLCSCVQQHFCQLKTPLQESCKVLSLHCAGRRVPWANWSNCNLPVQTQLHQWAFITPHIPQLPYPGYKDMHSCCSVAQKLNVISGITPPFHKQDSVTGSTANSPSLQTWFSPFPLQASYPAPMHPFSGASL